MSYMCVVAVEMVCLRDFFNRVSAKGINFHKKKKKRAHRSYFQPRRLGERLSVVQQIDSTIHYEDLKSLSKVRSSSNSKGTFNSERYTISASFSCFLWALMS